MRLWGLGERRPKKGHTMILQYFVRYNYGAYAEYLASPAVAATVAQLTGRKTISASDRAALSALTGCTWELVPDPRNTPPTIH